MDDKSELHGNMEKAMNMPDFDLSENSSTNGAYSGTEPQPPVSQHRATRGSKFKTPFDEKLKGFGIALLFAFVISAALLPRWSTVDVSNAAKNALSEQVSTTLYAGAVLLERDKMLAAQDHTITHSSNQNSTKIWIWDYAAEDGDYVQVFVDGMPISYAFFIKNKPVELTVPAVGLVQVKGISDGGGGITYAVKYDLNQTTYFNSAPEGQMNTYTLMRK